MSEKSIPYIVGLGEVLWDVLPSGARLGGAPANFAVFCARLGNRAALISSIGEDDYGIAAKRILTQPGLGLHNLQKSEVRATGTVEVSFSSGGQPSYNISTDVAWDFIQLTPEVHKAAFAADAVCYGTLAQRNPVSRSTIRGFLQATRPECVRVCDVNLRMPHCSSEILQWSMAKATVIKVSDDELPLVFSLLDQLLSSETQPYTMRDTLHGAANLLLEQFPSCRLIAMTLGSSGSMITTREKTYKHPGFPIKLADTVGAGDAFTAGLTHAYLRGASLFQMAEVGNLCGSFVASQPGASPLLSSELMENIDASLRGMSISVASQ